MTVTNSGPILALLSAILFGISPALAKATIGEMSPALLAGILYLGSGMGLQVILWLKGQSSIKELRTLTGRQRIKLIGAVAFGGILAPLCLAFGIKYATAVEISLLLNLETVATTVIAALVFHEHVSGRVWIGKAILIFGAILITTHAANGFDFSLPGLFVVAACLFWGIDNNLTRDIEQLSPVVLASVKGICAGAFNTLLAVILGVGLVTVSQMFIVLVIGAISYGLSLVLFIKALRLMGSSRTSTYFASGPFFGMLISILLLGEQPTFDQWIAALLMAIGLWALFGEKHEHLHTHEPMTHQHLHVHDDHHHHDHDGSEGPEPHDHLHTHQPITHAHWHLPDIHHRHRH